MRRARTRIVAARLLALGILVAASARAPGEGTGRVSLSAAGVEGDGTSRGACIGPGGRFVAFVSEAAGLVAGDRNGARDVFLFDRAALRIERVSLGAAGQEGNANSFHPSLCRDAALVAFESVASNLVPGDDNGVRDVFVRDRVAGSTILVSATPAGGPGNGASFAPCLALEGRVVAFRSHADDLVPGDRNGLADLFVRDLRTGTTVRASVSVDGGDPDGPSNLSSLTAQGKLVAFESAASNLVAADTNGWTDIFVRDLVGGGTERVSVASDGTEADGESRAPSISADGRFVVFESDATNLVAGDANGLRDVFVHDRLTGTTLRVSLSSAGEEGGGASRAGRIAPGGGIVAFESDAADLVPGDTNGVADVFARDLEAGVTTRVSLDGTGVAGDAASGRPSLSDDGRYVAFESLAGNLVPGDRNDGCDVFVRDRGQGADPACRAGNVNAGAGGAVDVLAVNGSSGSPVVRAVVLEPGDPLEIFMDAPPSRPGGPSRFALYAWLGIPDDLTARDLPQGVGAACLPMPPSGGGAPRPRAVWNNLGHPEVLGEATLPSGPAPSVVLSLPAGVGRRVSFTLQGLIRDSASPQGRFAVTNAVVVVVP